MKLGLAQIDVSWENDEENKLKCEKFIYNARESGVDLVLFPEMTLTGFSMDVNKICDKNGQAVNWFKDKAKHYDLNIGFGYVEKEKDLGKNKYMIVDSTGNSVIEYSKIHPFSYAMEDKYFKCGSNICTAKVNDMLITTFICYDLRFPEIFQAASRDVHLIVVAANWPEARKEHWISLNKARAIENQCYVAAVNRVGEGNSIYYSGNSLVVSPDGEILAECVDEEKLLICEVDVNEVINTRERFPVKKDRKESLYIKLLKGEESPVSE